MLMANRGVQIGKRKETNTPLKTKGETENRNEQVNIYKRNERSKESKRGQRRNQKKKRKLPVGDEAPC